MGEGTDGLRNVNLVSHPNSQASMPNSRDSISQHALPQDTVALGSEPAAISLDDLRRAFEDAMQMSKGLSLSADRPSPDGSPETPHDGSPPRPSEPNVVRLTPASILEAILFVGSPLQTSVSMTALTDILHGMSLKDISKTIDELNASYRKGGHPWHILCEGDECSLQLWESIETELSRLQTTSRDTPLSQNSIDCLSMIAYRPGITKNELESLWGQNAGATLGYLMKRNLVRVEQPSISDVPRYFTTLRFLEILGVESLDDLPQGEEL